MSIPITKGEQLTDPDSPWNKIAMDEPVFIIRAQDKLAADRVMEYARELRQNEHTKDKAEKILSVEIFATAMENFPMERKKWPD